MRQYIACVPTEELMLMYLKRGSQLTLQLNIWTSMRSNRIGILPKLIIKKAFEIDPNIVTKLVAKERNFVNITENMILEVSPKLPRDLAKILTTDFYDDSWIELANKIE